MADGLENPTFETFENPTSDAVKADNVRGRAGPTNSALKVQCQHTSTHCCRVSQWHVIGCPRVYVAGARRQG